MKEMVLISAVISAVAVCIAMCATPAMAQAEGSAPTLPPLPGEATTPPAPRAPAPALPTIEIVTSLGTIKAQLWPEKAPLTVENVLQYVKDGFYDGLIFHRVISGFMIQGGGFTPDMQQKATRAPVRNEARSDTPNRRGTLAMARTSDVNSATAQFFINHADNAFLNHRDETPRGFGYCVFGQVTEGMDVVDSIAKVRTGNKGPFQDVPQEPVVIQSVRVLP